MQVIDVHTHMLNREWFELLKKQGAPHYTAGKNSKGQDIVMYDGASFLTPVPEHFDYEARIRNMNAAYVDVAIVSLTAPNASPVSLSTARA